MYIHIFATSIGKLTELNGKIITYLMNKTKNQSLHFLTWVFYMFDHKVKKFLKVHNTPWTITCLNVLMYRYNNDIDYKIFQKKSLKSFICRFRHIIKFGFQS